jgi:hypothetical protein
MDRMTTYEIHTTTEMLRSAHDGGALLEQLEAPLRSMVSEIATRVATRPLSIYVCSRDRDAESRNFFAYVLAMWIQKRVPGTLLVDCDFLATGLSGVVPHHDALGYLDLLLYGTSLGVITQEANAGVPVIGAGSFPVTKKRPFAMDAFDNTRRYLANHSKCVVYCGPVHDDDDMIHPIAEHVDLVMLVNVADRFREGSLDPLESSVASAKRLDAWSVRVNVGPLAKPTGMTPVVDAGAGPEEEETAALVAEVEGIVETGATEDADKAADATAGETAKKPTRSPAEKTSEPEQRMPVPGRQARAHEAEGAIAGAVEAAAGRRGEQAAPVGDIGGPALERTMRSSRWLRIVTPIVGICLIAFVVWWLYLTKAVREREQELAGAPGGAVVTDQPAQPTDSTGAPSPATPPPATASEDTKAVTARETDSPDTTQRDVHTQTTDGVKLAERLDDYANQYLVHVSSFRRLDRARDEALYLMGWDYPVFLYRIDLGGKGIWYRVYVGPADTREEARAFKIKLDENPRIQSTRIARVPN